MSDRAGVCWLSLAESKQTEGSLSILLIYETRC